MSRAGKRVSVIFRDTLHGEHARLLLEGRKAGRTYAHRGIIGDERANALKEFFKERLSSTFAVGKGEAVDFLDNKSGQLDLFIYNQKDCAPVSRDSENLLIPCEGLYVVIEVKSVLNGEEIEKAFHAAGKIRRLHPYKGSFVKPAAGGRTLPDNCCRCMYVLFAFTSNLASENWAHKEYARIKDVAKASGMPLHLIDRVFVLDRGLIHPAQGQAQVAPDEESANHFLQFYLSVVNFLSRELTRRDPIDWEIYSGKNQIPRIKLEPEPPLSPGVRDGAKT